jgi:hypothetical protein
VSRLHAHIQRAALAPSKARLVAEALRQSSDEMLRRRLPDRRGSTI